MDRKADMYRLDNVQESIPVWVCLFIGLSLFVTVINGKGVFHRIIVLIALFFLIACVKGLLVEMLIACK